ncbi:MAG: ATP-binding cassette domain-containing protein [Sphingobacteriaceae bacterium]|nr:ATP-binding cassette domain-containing protein [Sphingobacteriaceae bacterium]
MKPILEINNISKKFRINHELGTYLSLRDRLSQLLVPKNTKEDFWALRDVTFNVEEGDSVGIIGKNGAGKSTLLKILSKITPPSSGKIISRGRMASLLEVGTGFHPELSGRENIFMNGSILGMKRSEIAKNFDAIVDFSGVEKFIDTPLKHYSSGMQLRLAFAVAAFLENEILIIDEVLAVGDAEFQKKCMGKMGEVSKSGRTILFVSHNLESIITLCKKGVILEKGIIQKVGEIKEVIDSYTSNYQDSFKSWAIHEMPGDSIVRLSKVYLINTDNVQIYQPQINQEFGICVEYEVLKENEKPALNLHFYNSHGVYCFITITNTPELSAGNYKNVTWIPANYLNNQTYRVGVAFTTLKTECVHLYEREIINIEIIESKVNRKHEYGGQIPGVIRPETKNEIIKIN